MDIIFCTITTKFRLYQCIALNNSLRQFHSDAVLAVLCMDEAAFHLLEKSELPGILPIPLEILEDIELREIKAGRSLKEYCWTMKPVFIEYLLKKHQEAEIVIYLDSDLYFFDDPLKLIKKDKSWNVILTTHKVNRRVNSGFLAFRRSRTSYRMLDWWRKKCIVWCYDRKEGSKFGDQGHLDEMRIIFCGVRYINNPGANIAPWNYHNCDFSVKRGKLYVGRCRLTFFHFSGFRIKQVGQGSFAFDSDVPCEVCSTYVSEVMRALDNVNRIDGEMTCNFFKGI